jgi:hypothetical protein
MAAEGGLASLTVTAQPECGWSASAGVSWITELSPASGQGNAQVQFRVAPNPAFAARQAEILLNDTPILLTQDGARCTFSVAPLAPEVSDAGEDINVVVATAADCDWGASSNVPWVTLPGGPSGRGPGEFEMQVAPNTGPRRSASVSVGDQTITITQVGAAGLAVVSAAAGVVQP